MYRDGDPVTETTDRLVFTGDFNSDFETLREWRFNLLESLDNLDPAALEQAIEAAKAILIRSNPQYCLFTLQGSEYFVFPSNLVQRIRTNGETLRERISNPTKLLGFVPDSFKPSYDSYFDPDNDLDTLLNFTSDAITSSREGNTSIFTFKQVHAEPALGLRPLEIIHYNLKALEHPDVDTVRLVYPRYVTPTTHMGHKITEIIKV